MMVSPKTRRTPKQIEADAIMSRIRNIGLPKIVVKVFEYFHTKEKE